MDGRIHNSLTFLFFLPMYTSSPHGSIMDHGISSSETAYPMPEQRYDWNAGRNVRDRAECHSRLLRQCTEEPLAFENIGSTMLPPQYGMVSKEESSEAMEDLQLTAPLDLLEIMPFYYYPHCIGVRSWSNASKYTRRHNCRVMLQGNLLLTLLISGQLYGYFRSGVDFLS